MSTHPSPSPRAAERTRSHGPTPAGGVAGWALSALAFGQAAVGAWAAVWPHSFFDAFPGLGLRWVIGDGPFNEHLTRDVGGLSLSLAVLTVAAVRTAGQVSGRWLALAWEAYAVPHLAFHIVHLDHLDRRVDQVSSLVALSVSVGVPLIYALAWRRAGADDARRAR
ncbi:MAG: hypothetical protein HYR62_10110 [Actinobacteria bacterium]|nr:hypothetical protein [Actinomycetota bacterium]MBI3686400.1 hypothetical protein [Actinomycetota bacterium]